MQVLGTVMSVSVDKQVKKNGGGTYQGWELVYRAQDDAVRTIAKPIQGLRFNAPLKAQLESLSPEDQFTLEQEKNQQGFYDVKSIVKGWDANAGELKAPTERAQAASTAKSTGNSYSSSSYPTAEERTKTQNHIIRQSSLAQANATLAVGSKGVNPDDVLALAEKYVAWVKNEKTGMEAIAELEDDIPY